MTSKQFGISVEKKTREITSEMTIGEIMRCDLLELNREVIKQLQS